MSDAFQWQRLAHEAEETPGDARSQRALLARLRAASGSLASCPPARSLAIAASLDPETSSLAALFFLDLACRRGGRASRAAADARAAFRDEGAGTRAARRPGDLGADAGADSVDGGAAARLGLGGARTQLPDAPDGIRRDFMSTPDGNGRISAGPSASRAAGALAASFGGRGGPLDPSAVLDAALPLLLRLPPAAARRSPDLVAKAARAAAEAASRVPWRQRQCLPALFRAASELSQREEASPALAAALRTCRALGALELALPLLSPLPALVSSECSKDEALTVYALASRALECGGDFEAAYRAAELACQVAPLEGERPGAGDADDSFRTRREALAATLATDVDRMWTTGAAAPDLRAPFSTGADAPPTPPPPPPGAAGDAAQGPSRLRGSPSSRSRSSARTHPARLDAARRAPLLWALCARSRAIGVLTRVDVEQDARLQRRGGWGADAMRPSAVWAFSAPFSPGAPPPGASLLAPLPADDPHGVPFLAALAEEGIAFEREQGCGAGEEGEARRLETRSAMPSTAPRPPLPDDGEDPVLAEAAEATGEEVAGPDARRLRPSSQPPSPALPFGGASSAALPFGGASSAALPFPPAGARSSSAVLSLGGLGEWIRVHRSALAAAGTLSLAERATAEAPAWRLERLADAYASLPAARAAALARVGDEEALCDLVQREAAARTFSGARRRSDARRTERADADAARAPCSIRLDERRRTIEFAPPPRSESVARDAEALTQTALTLRTAMENQLRAQTWVQASRG